MSDQTKAARLDTVCAEIRAWQAETFTQPSLSGAVAHLSKEMAEIEAALGGAGTHEGRAHMAEELGDGVFLILQAMTILGADPATVLEHKLAKNKARRWGKPDADGVVEHVRDEPARATRFEGEPIGRDDE